MNNVISEPNNLQWNCSRKQSQSLAKFYFADIFQNILSEVCLNGVSMYRYRIRWLLSSGKVVEV